MAASAYEAGASTRMAAYLFPKRSIPRHCRRMLSFSPWSSRRVSRATSSELRAALSCMKARAIHAQAPTEVQAKQLNMRCNLSEQEEHYSAGMHVKLQLKCRDSQTMLELASW
eukprot:scaffold87914_cov18-Tisochrysis_lutea.AAC.1